jgi:hypothetical protein
MLRQYRAPTLTGRLVTLTRGLLSRASLRRDPFHLWVQLSLSGPRQLVVLTG